MLFLEYASCILCILASWLELFILLLPIHIPLFRLAIVWCCSNASFPISWTNFQNPAGLPFLDNFEFKWKCQPSRLLVVRWSVISEIFQDGSLFIHWLSKYLIKNVQDWISCNSIGRFCNNGVLCIFNISNFQKGEHHKLFNQNSHSTLWVLISCL